MKIVESKKSYNSPIPLASLSAVYEKRSFWGDKKRLEYGWVSDHISGNTNYTKKFQSANFSIALYSTYKISVKNLHLPP